MILPNEGKKFRRIADTTKMSHDEWLAARSRIGEQYLIGGSEWAQVLGVSNYGGMYSVWATKLGMLPPIEDNERMAWGRKLEDLIARELTEREGLEVQRVNSILQSIEYPFMSANLDRRVVGKPEGVECKAVGEWAGRHYEANEFFPDHYIQCQAYLMVTGWERWHLCVLIGGQRWVHRIIEPDWTIWEQIKEAGPRLIEYLETGEAPPAGDADKETLDCLYPSERDGKIVALDASMLTHFETYDEAQKVINDAEKLKAGAQNAIRQAIGDAEKGICGMREATWKTNKVGQRRLNIK